MTNKTAQQLFDASFGPGRTPRSDAYKQGVFACLQSGIDGLPRAECPYDFGTAEADAWCAGRAEGHALVRAERERAEPQGDAKYLCAVSPAAGLTIGSEFFEEAARNPIPINMDAVRQLQGGSDE